MGSYLSEPIVDKVSADEIGKEMSYGSSSMQGWRISQEDAHNHILNYDTGKCLFAVYDGHGGHEVAEYCSKYLPDYIKQNSNYASGNYEKALVDSFIGFDATLVDRKVVAELKQIQNNGEEEKEDEEEEINHLCQEASMPIEQVIAKYGGSPQSNGAPASTGEPSKPLANPALAGLRSGESSKPISPFLRGKVNKNLGEGGSGLNKHIRFNEQGDEVKVNGSHNPEETETKDGVKQESVNGDSKSLVESVVTQNGDSKENTDVKSEDKAEVNGETTPRVEDASSEKENKDTNGVTDSKEQDKVVVETIDFKGKGKGKGKGKSSQVKSSTLSFDIEVTKEQLQQVKEKKMKRSAYEIYSNLLKDAAQSGDEESEDSQDEEFGADVDSDSDSDEDGIEVDLEGEMDEDEEDSDDVDEEDEEEDGPLIEADFTEEPGNDSGCTAVLALIAGSKLYVANAGDSRCVVCRDGKPLEMSFDHKPEDEIELNRIKTAGGKVTPDGRVNGGLNLSRAIGDHAYKQNKSLPLKDQMISSQPDIKVLDLDLEKDSWMILACDGIWNFMSNEEVVQFVEKRIHSTEDGKLSTICEELFEDCLAPDTGGDGTGCDNMTAVIVKFKPALAHRKDVLTSTDSLSATSSSVAGVGSSSSSSSASGSSSSGASSSSVVGASASASSAPSSTSTTSSTATVDGADNDSEEPAPKRVKLDVEQ